MGRSVRGAQWGRSVRGAQCARGETVRATAALTAAEDQGAVLPALSGATLAGATLAGATLAALFASACSFSS